MKSKLIILITIITIALTFSACNYQLIDLNYKFNYCYIKLQNGEVIEGEVDAWRDYDDSDQIQITMNDTVYLVHSMNCTLIYKPELETKEIKEIEESLYEEDTYTEFLYEEEE